MAALKRTIPYSIACNSICHESAHCRWSLYWKIWLQFASRLWYNMTINKDNSHLFKIEGLNSLHIQALFTHLKLLLSKTSPFSLAPINTVPMYRMTVFTEENKHGIATFNFLHILKIWDIFQLPDLHWNIPLHVLFEKQRGVLFPDQWDRWINTGITLFLYMCLHFQPRFYIWS